MYYLFFRRDVRTGNGKIHFNIANNIGKSKSYALAKAAAYRSVNGIASKEVVIVKHDGSPGPVAIGASNLMGILSWQNGSKFYKDPAKAKAHTGVVLTSIGASGGSGFINSRGELKK